jgi:hypothetical protein
MADHRWHACPHYATITAQYIQETRSSSPEANSVIALTKLLLPHGGNYFTGHQIFCISAVSSNPREIWEQRPAGGIRQVEIGRRGFGGGDAACSNIRRNSSKVKTSSIFTAHFVAVGFPHFWQAGTMKTTRNIDSVHLS